MSEPIVPGAPGTGQPGGQPNPPGTDPNNPTPEFLTKAEFGKTAALIGGLQKTIKDLTTGMLSMESLAQVGLVEKAEDGTYRVPKAVTAPPAPGKNTPPNPEEDPTLKRVKALEKQLADRDTELANERRRAEDNTRNAELQTALSDAGAINPNRDYVHLIGSVAKGDQGWAGNVKDEYGADKAVTLKDLAESFLKTNPELKKASSQGGSGTAPNSGAGKGTGPNNGKVIPKAQWSDMSFMLQHRAKFDSGEYVRGQ